MQADRRDEVRLVAPAVVRGAAPAVVDVVGGEVLSDGWPGRSSSDGRQPTVKVPRGNRMETGFAGRLAEPFILALVARKPTHGYGLLQSLEEAFGAGSIAKARVYQMLRRLEEEGLVSEAGQEGNRKLYHLTDMGHDALASFESQTPAFYRLLKELLPAVRVSGVLAEDERVEVGAPMASAGLALPRSAQACEACLALRVRIERDAGEPSLQIEISRPQDLYTETGDAARGGLGLTAGHTPGCPVQEAVRLLLSRLLD